MKNILDTHLKLSMTFLKHGFNEESLEALKDFFKPQKKLRKLSDAEAALYRGNIQRLKTICPNLEIR